MEVFVQRSPNGFVTYELEDVAELGERLSGIAAVKPLEDEAEVQVEITGKWSEIRELLGQPCFRDVWFRPETPMSLLDGEFNYDAGEHVVRCQACGWWHRALTEPAAELMAKGHLDGSQPDIPKCAKQHAR